MQRANLVRILVDVLTHRPRERPIRVAITGIDAAGKTTLADELAAACRARGRPAIRASIDDFYRPGHIHRATAGEYSPRSYYDGAFDFDAFAARFLGPLGPGGDRRVRLASWQMLPDLPAPDAPVDVEPDAIAIVDGVFLLRPELRPQWDVVVWLEVGADTAMTRALARDLWMVNSADVVRDRYQGRNFPAHALYVDATGGSDAADVVIDNTDVDDPRLVRGPGATGPASAPGRRPDLRALARALTGAVLTPEDADYDRHRKLEIARFDDVRPLAVVRCACEADVRESVTFARRHGLELTVRSGGHCYAGFSIGRGLVLDLRPMSAVRVEAGTVIAGAGASLGQLFDALEPHRLMVPTGTYRSVGLSGSTFGGGWGAVGRSRGLTLDHLVEARIVLADGRTLTCAGDRHDDLFWALRGAGAGNFGVVTELRLRTYPAHPLTNFACVLPFSAAAPILTTWQRWAESLPDAVTCVLGFDLPEALEREPLVALHGAMVGTEAEIDALVDDLLARAKVTPRSWWRRTQDWVESTRYWAGEYKLLPLDARDGHRYTKSEYFARPLPVDAAAALADAFVRDRAAGQKRGLEFTHLGGACGRVPRDATAFWHRDQPFLIKHKSVVDPAAPDTDKASALRWVNESYATIHPHGSGTTYPNYPDPELDDYLAAYYGGHVARLIEIKAKYDPDNVFRFAQSIPPRR